MTWFSWLLLILCIGLYVRVFKLSRKNRKIREVEYLLENQRYTILDLYSQLQKQHDLVEDLTYHLNQKGAGKKKYSQRKLPEINQDSFDEISSISTVVLQEQEIIEIYNSEPTSLLSSAVKVSVKPESIISTNKNEPIILANIGNGNYCLIPDTDINYWLLPKANLKIDQYRYETVKLLFECDEYELEFDNYRLDKPAKVSLLPNEREWKLEERGVLRFVNSLYEELVDLYNNNINVLSTYIVAKVSPSINDKQVILKKAVSYDYLTIDGEDNNYWLVPKEDIKIHFSKYQELQNLFDCDGYQENYSSFILAKPAKVSAILEQIHWQLEERGKIVFI
ncbi:hypothetical protein [Chlorogloea sp. CCALA 695]|uniref:hypothetical protein n=1 Tax=Chlorogloea sp. CCALA 695 TaxID=2107693 RepID=UPI000D070ADD|nr:hypothetical protein [Chlorogloea sp. CCALA 695]PSB31201.1 hypothetical protein C7B70_14220 [Chlorogloea sp. CCALA 695]